MAESKIVKAEIKFVFTDNGEPKAVVKKKYADGSEIKAEGIQAFEKAQELLEKLIDNPIYTPSVTP